MSDWRDMADALLGDRRRSLVAYAYHLTGSVTDAEDLVHDAVVKVLSRPRKFTELGLAEEYVRRAIASRFVDIHRSRSTEARRLRRSAPREEVEGPASSVEANLDLMQALATLTARQRACVTLRYLADQSITQTAAALGLSEGAVKRYVSDGVSALEIALGVDDVRTETVPVGQRRMGK